MWFPCRKKIVLALFVSTTLFSAAVSAHEGYRGGYHGGGGIGWVAPAIIGGVIGYELGQPRTVYVQPAPPPVIYQPQVIYTQPTYSTIPPAGYHFQYLLDGTCNCYRTVLVPN